MARTSVLSESVLRAALAGLEARRDQIMKSITELKAALGDGAGRPVSRPTKESGSASPAKAKVQRRNTPQDGSGAEETLGRREKT